MIRSAFAATLAGLLAGCASSLSGIGGTERYGCKAPEGAFCTSVSGVYANTTHGATGPTQPALLPARGTTQSYGAAPVLAHNPTALPSGTAIRSNARVLRVWIAPWEDSDGDLHEEAVVHVLVDTGRWLIEHVRPAARGRIDAVGPPVAGTTEEARPRSEPASSPDTLPRAGALAREAR